MADFTIATLIHYFLIHVMSFYLKGSRKTQRVKGMWVLEMAVRHMEGRKEHNMEGGWGGLLLYDDKKHSST